MKRGIIIGLALCGFVIIASPSVQEALAFFVIAGVIPGTSFVVPPLVMLALLLVALILCIRLAHKQTRAIKLPSLEEAVAPRQKGRDLHTLFRDWRNTFGPQLELLQQKLVAFMWHSYRVAVQLRRKARQIYLEARGAVGFPVAPFRIAEALRKVAGLVTKK